MKVLLTAVGKRIQLIKHLKKTFTVIGVDSGELVPSAYFVDSFLKVPRIDSPNYVSELIKICKDEKVQMLIPLYEREYNLLNEHREEFNKNHIILLLSNCEVIEICNNKSNTYKFFKENNIDTPKSFDKSEIRQILKKESPLNLKFPMIVKPEDGMGSSNVFKVKNAEELAFFIEYVKNPIIQEFIEGTEYTIDILCDLQGKVISVVPRERIEVRSGEVVKSRSIKNQLIIKKTLELCNKFNFIGPVTVQCIDDGEYVKFIEINPRFGGGVPLTFESGVDYGRYLKEMILGNVINPAIGEFEEKTMLRYDEAVIL